MGSIRNSVVMLLALMTPAAGAAQERGSVAEATIGYAGFVDDSTKHFVVVGGAVRRYFASRISIGPEFIVMSGSGQDRNMMLTGNVVFDIGWELHQRVTGSVGVHQ